MEDDELQDDQPEAEAGQEGTDSGSDDSAPPESKPAAKGEGTRVNDLMSKWQTEEARANRLQAQLDAANGTTTTAPPAAAPQGSNDDIAEFREFARENARNTLFGSAPQLAEAGLAAEDITGSTVAEMRESMKKHLRVIGGMEGRLRNKILAEHGLDPEVATGSGTEKPESFSTMTDKEFDDYLRDRDSRPR